MTFIESPMIERLAGDWHIRERKPQGTGPHPLCILLHGWTGDESSMEIFVKAFPPSVWLVLPRGIYTSPSGGFSWYANQGKAWPWMDDFNPSIEALLELGTEENFPGALLDQFDILGFSQGAALAYAFAFLYPQRVRRLAGLAGFLPDGGEALARNRPLHGKKVFVAHGSQDQLVPVEKGRACVEVLKNAGGEVVYCESEAGHKLSQECFRGLMGFFRIYG